MKINTERLKQIAKPRNKKAHFKLMLRHKWFRWFFNITDNIKLKYYIWKTK